MPIQEAPPALEAELDVREEPDEDDSSSEAPPAAAANTPLPDLMMQGAEPVMEEKTAPGVAYRKATPEEFRELSKSPGAKAIGARFNCEPFDIRIREK